MALATATISYKIADLIGTPPAEKSAKVWASTNVEGDTLIDTDANLIRLGCGTSVPDANGSGSLTVWIPGEDSNPETWQTSIHVDYRDRHGRASRTFGPFTIDTAALTRAVSNKALTSNVATLITSTAHGLVVGNSVTVAGVDSTFNGTYTVVSVPTATTFTYAKTASNVTSVAATGTTYSPSVNLADMIPELAITGGDTIIGGSSSLIVVSGGTVDLDNDEANGYLIGYHVTATTTIEGVVLAPGVYIFRRDSTEPTGWATYSIGFGSSPEPIDVTPTAPTFTDGTNTITIPSVTGVVYSLDGSPLAAGAHPGYAPGDVLVTAAASTGYNLIGGTYSWGHTFGALDPTPIEPDELTNLALWYDPSAVGAVTTSGGLVTTLRNDGSLTTSHNLTETDPAKQPTTTTVNGLTAILFDADGEQMRKLSMSAPANGADITVWAVVKMNATVLGGSNQITFTTISADPAGEVSLPQGIRVGPYSPHQMTVPNAWTNTGDVLFVAYTLPASGATKVWIGDDVSSATFTHDTMSHLFLGTGTGRFAFCEGGIYGGIKTDADMAGLYSHLKTKWGTL